MWQDNLFRELIVDNFAGGGGASTGIELALGRANCAEIAVSRRLSTMAQLHRQMGRKNMREATK